MATQEELTELADNIMAPELAAQALHARHLKESELRQARFMHIASIALAIAYAGFVISRILNGKPLDALSIIVVAAMVLGVFSTRRRYVSGRSSLAAI